MTQANKNFIQVEKEKTMKEKEKFHKQIYDDPKAADDVLLNMDKYPEGSEERALAWDTCNYNDHVKRAKFDGREPISRESPIWKELSKTAAARRAREDRIMRDPNISDEEAVRKLDEYNKWMDS